MKAPYPSSQLQMHAMVCILAAAIIFTCTLNGMAQVPKTWRKEAKSFQQNLEKEYADSATSPLRGQALKDFAGLDFFPINKAFCVQAAFERISNEAPFEMPTVSGKTKTFQKYGCLSFEIGGKKAVLYAYQNLKLMQIPEYADDLFIPFKDQSSGEESYGGGRYIDIKIPKGTSITLDFNRAYNPYCAYSTGWNCPIPPVENDLDFKVLAGVKAPKNGH